VLHVGKFTRGLGLFSPCEYRPSAELPDEEYPFVLSTGRCYFHFHTGTMTRREPQLDREERFPYVEMDVEDAKKISVRDWDTVTVSTRRGEVNAIARVRDTMIPGIMFMPFHFEEGPANRLTINALDPEAKIPEFKVCAANVRRAN
jgi:formate dehydrogenase major subunit/formate dehydrogenase alpha subunit